MFDNSVLRVAKLGHYYNYLSNNLLFLLEAQVGAVPSVNFIILSLIVDFIVKSRSRLTRGQSSDEFTSDLLVPSNEIASRIPSKFTESLNSGFDS